MAANVDAESYPTDRRPAASSVLRLAPWLALAALFLVAITRRHVLPANTDVSSLLTAAEWVIDRQRLYADVIEMNPAIAVARALGLLAEMVTDGPAKNWPVQR